MIIDEIKIGDKVKVTQPYGGLPYIAEVVKINKASFVVKYERSTITFNANGRMRGADAWHASYAYIATDDVVKEVEEQNLKRKYSRIIKDIDFEKVPFEDVESVYEILKKYINK